MGIKELLKKHRAVLVLNGKPLGVNRVSVPPLEEFVGFKRQREALIKNTKSLLEEKPFNDALLWGKRGTGKSSLVRAMLNLSPRLKLIQIDRDEVGFLFEVLEHLWEFEERFIVLIEDLSFTDETLKGIRLLKTLLDGSVIERPPNVVFYATSNRRNLSPEIYLERDYKFPREELEERLSLADRFGLKLGFTEFTKADYLEAVKLYCKKYGIEYDEKVKREAIKYLADREPSGRAALHFVKSFIALRG